MAVASMQRTRRCDTHWCVARCMLTMKPSDSRKFPPQCHQWRPRQPRQRLAPKGATARGCFACSAPYNCHCSFQAVSLHVCHTAPPLLQRAVLARAGKSQVGRWRSMDAGNDMSDDQVCGFSMSLPLFEGLRGEGYWSTVRTSYYHGRRDAGWLIRGKHSV